MYNHPILCSNLQGRICRRAAPVNETLGINYIMKISFPIMALVFVSTTRVYDSSGHAKGRFPQNVSTTKPVESAELGNERAFGNGQVAYKEDNAVSVDLAMAMTVHDTMGPTRILQTAGGRPRTMHAGSIIVCQN
ncbi:hypothetical protein A9K55_008550 [Cordyceps militaris]|uniref:Uncharacterized protein n=1 Tax=Cordyceps militaris TaxID=73501 RepID=A0A2H4SI30_CORMI|nr:hypothetical protein A9K55_008550 [Cordyceps militaris]